MRRQDRYIFNGILLGAGLTTIADVLLQWREVRQKGEHFTWEIYNGWRTLKYAAIGGGVGGGIGNAIYSYKASEESKLPFNSDEYIKKILTEEHLKSNPTLFKKVDAERQKIKQSMVELFGNNLVSLPEDTGSFIKRSAIVSNYDLDIVLPFKRNSYSSLEEMYFDVHDVILKKYGAIATVTKQTKAIGLTFENSGDPIHFDLVPGREINDYAKEKDLNLYVKPNWIWQRGGSFKTNIGMQKTITINKPEARTTIKLLKVYRDRNELLLPTFMVEQCVVAALSESNFGIYTSPTENLLNSMDYISKKLEQKTLIDPANSNHNLQDKISDYQRIYISNQLQNDIKRIEENPRYIQEIFDC